MFKGYWRNPEKTAEEISADGFFITGDVATMDEDGRVTISGRAKDLIITGGFNVYPREVEEVSIRCPASANRRRLACRIRDFGEAVIALSRTTGDCSGRARTDRADVGKRLAKFKLPKRIFSVAELPRNAMGKVQKAELRKIYAGTFGQ